MSTSTTLRTTAFLYLASLCSTNTSEPFVRRSSCLLRNMSTHKRQPSNTKQTSMTRFLTTRDNGPSETSSFKIFCDLDGVLCDFDAGVRRINNGKGADDMHLKELWRSVARADSFYANLPWMTDGRDLWEAIVHLKPDILTGVPMHEKSRQEKAAWCARELGVETNHVDMAGTKRAHFPVQGKRKQNAVNVITCWSRNKYMESGHKVVLIDDRLDLRENWESRGGIFVHHTNAERTLQKLMEHGIL